MTPNFNEGWVSNGVLRIDKYRRDKFRKDMEKAFPEFDIFAVACYVYEHYTGEFPKIGNDVSWDNLYIAIKEADIEDEMRAFISKYSKMRTLLMDNPLLSREEIIKQALCDAEE